MKKLAFIFTLLAGCTAQQSSSPVPLVQACDGYRVAFAAALQARNDGKLNQTQINTITLADENIYPLCTGNLVSIGDAELTLIHTTTDKLLGAVK